MNAYRFSNGDSIENRYIIPVSKGTGGVMLKDAFSKLKEGVNVFSLVRHWSQINIINVIAGGANNINQITTFADSYGLLGLGLYGSSVYILPDEITQAGFRSSPQFGVGAIYSVNKNATPPQGYVSFNLGERGTLAIPDINASSLSGATGPGSFIGMPAGVGSVSASCYEIHEKWNKSYTNQKYNSLEGGSALVAGLEEMSFSNPYLFGGVVAATLCDSIARASDKNEGAYYANEAIYFSVICGVSLSRLISGKKDSSVDEKGKEYAKAILMGLPKSEKVTESIFQALVTSIKGLYSYLGIKSKADVFQLANQAYAENRLNEMDTVSIQYIAEVLYDSLNGYQMFLNILAGRFLGIHAALVTNEDVTQITVIGGETLKTEEVPVAQRARLVDKQRREAQASSQQLAVTSEAVAEGEAMAEEAPEEMVEEEVATPTQTEQEVVVNG